MKALTFTADTYDKNGNRTSMTDATGTTTYTYDQLNRLRAVQQPRMYPTLYDYDNAGHMTKVTYTSGDTVEYAYNGQAMLSAAKVTMGGTAYDITFEYDQYGLLKSKTLPNGLITTYAFDRANRVTSSVTTLGAATIASTSYPVYDGNSNLKHAVVNSRTIDYTYDAQNQLMIANTTSHASYERFTYDASGNRLTMTTPSGIANYTYDSDNRLVHTYGAMANTVYVYDGDGNLTQKVMPDEVIQFTYNAANRLVGWTNGTSVVSFEYDGDGNRVSKTVDGEKTRYLNDVAGPVSQVLLELDDTYHVTAKYFYGGERLMQYRGAMAYYVYDAPGRSVIALVNTPSSVMNSYAYGAFGGIINTTEPIYNDYLYDGEQYDEETGLIYLRNRYYDPEIGRFITKDPYPGELINPITINPYPFVGNNPITRIDPLGLADKGQIWTGLTEAGVGAWDLRNIATLGSATYGVGALVLLPRAMADGAAISHGLTKAFIGLFSDSLDNNYVPSTNLLPLGALILTGDKQTADKFQMFSDTLSITKSSAETVTVNSPSIIDNMLLGIELGNYAYDTGLEAQKSQSNNNSDTSYDAFDSFGCIGGSGQ